MCCLAQITNMQTKKMIYYGYFNSIMSYGIIVWGIATGWERVFKIQKQIIRIMANAGFKDSCRPLFKKMGILTQPSLYLFNLLNYFHINFNTIQEHQNQHSHNTRFKENIKYPSHRLTLLEKSPYYMGIRVFNKLPKPIRLIENHNQFKKTVREILINKAYYSVKEYMDE